MKYAAVIRIGLGTGILSDPSDESWHMIEFDNEYKHEWRFNKSGDFDVVVGLFEDAKQALKYAKKLYISVLYMILHTGLSIKVSGCEEYGDPFHKDDEGPFIRNVIDSFRSNYIGDEPFFIWGLQDHGVDYGIGIYEVVNTIEECKKRAFDFGHTIGTFKTPQAQFLDFFKIEELKNNLFSFSEKSQEILFTLLNASTFQNLGMEMTIYCGILEHLAPTEKKSEEEQKLIDELVAIIKSSDLDSEKKSQMASFLETGRTQSSRQRCKNLANKYCKENYGGYKTSKIIGAAYSIRSKYSHGETNIYYIKEAEFMKCVVMDVIRGMFSEDELKLCINSK